MAKKRVHKKLSQSALVKAANTIANAESSSFDLTRSRRTFFDAAGHSPRRFRGMVTSDASATTVAVSNNRTLRNRSHDIARNNPWGYSGIESLVSNWIGTGIKPQSRAPERTFREEAHALFKRWTDESDFDGITDFYGQQAILAWAFVESGEVFARFRLFDLTSSMTIPLQIKLLEPDHVPLFKTESTEEGGHIRAGIEFDSNDKRRAYHMFPNHPGDNLLVQSATNTVRIPAEEVLHVFRPTRPGQIRGFPHLARVLLRLLSVDEGDDAELVKKKIQSLFTGFLRLPDDAPDVFRPESFSDLNQRALAPLEPGATQVLYPGEQVDFAEPPSISSSHADFMRYHLHGIAAGLGVTYEQLSGDLSQVNFSSIRAGLNEFYRRCEMIIHQSFVFQFCRPVWRRFVTEAVLAGLINAPGFATNPDPWLDCDWQPQGWDYVNPLQEVRADKIAVDEGFTTRSRVITRQGDDPEEIDRERRMEQERERELGLAQVDMER